MNGSTVPASELENGVGGWRGSVLLVGRHLAIHLGLSIQLEKHHIQEACHDCLPVPMLSSFLPLSSLHPVTCELYNDGNSLWIHRPGSKYMLRKYFFNEYMQCKTEERHGRVNR